MRDVAVSPNEKEVFYTLISPNSDYSAIAYSKRVGRAWTDPRTAAFSGRFLDLEPFVAPDGETLYFISNRPMKQRPNAKDFNIWYCKKSNGVWGRAFPLDTNINTPLNESRPTLSNYGALYFSRYNELSASEDIFFCTKEKGKFTPPVPLDDNLNSSKTETNAYIAPDERFILFASDRKPCQGGTDIFIAYKSGATWLKPKPLSGLINSGVLEFAPFVSYNGEKFFFSSERDDINNLKNTSMSFDSFLQLLGNPANTTGNVYWVNARQVIPY